MSDKPLSEMTIRELVDEAYDAGTYGVELSPYLEEAARRDALADPELLTAAWLHGADHARRKARWPEPTDEAAEQLAEAIKAADYIIQPPEFYRRKAAFVLRRLREQEGEDV